MAAPDQAAQKPARTTARSASAASERRPAFDRSANAPRGGGIGWGLDWLCGRFGFHTRPVLMLVFFVLGMAAGIRNVMRAAKEINAEIANRRSDKETGS